MKAITFDQFGSSSVLKITEIPTPIPKPDEVLIKLTHTSVNPVDWKIREGHIQQFLPHRFPIIPGWDAAGEVVEVGTNVKTLVPEDLVYAYTRLSEVHSGTYAEFIALPESIVAKKPHSLDLATSSAVPLAALTAYQALHECAQIKPGNKVLITAGAGGVGTFAIQFAKLVGAEVTATASTQNLDYLRKLGATHAVDYTKETLTETAQRIAPDGFDVILDCVGGQILKDAESVAKSTERLVSIVETPERGKFHFVYPNKEQLSTISKLFDSNQLIPPDIKIRSINDAVSAQDENMKRHTRGKVVLTIDFLPHESSESIEGIYQYFKN